jgi:hypothetical protein
LAAGFFAAAFFFGAAFFLAAGFFAAAFFFGAAFFLATGFFAAFFFGAAFFLAAGFFAAVFFGAAFFFACAISRTPFPGWNSFEFTSPTKEPLQLYTIFLIFEYFCLDFFFARLKLASTHIHDSRTIRRGVDKKIRATRLAREQKLDCV